MHFFVVYFKLFLSKILKSYLLVICFYLIFFCVGVHLFRPGDRISIVSIPFFEVFLNKIGKSWSSI